MLCTQPLLPVLMSLALSAAPEAREEPIRQLVQQYLDARDRNDPAALRKLMAPGADQLVSSGEWRSGVEALVAGTLASSRRTGGTRAITLEAVRFLTADVAVADGRYDLSGLSAGGSRRMWSTFILVRTPEGWRIAAIRNMLPAPAAPAK